MSEPDSDVVVVGSGGAGTVNLDGLGGTLQLQVLANYTSGKQIDETNFSTYTVTPEGFYWTYDSNGNEQAQVTMPEKVFIVQAEFFQAGAGHVGQLEFAVRSAEPGLSPAPNPILARSLSEPSWPALAQQRLR